MILPVAKGQNVIWAHPRVLRRHDCSLFFFFQPEQSRKLQSAMAISAGDAMLLVE